MQKLQDILTIALMRLSGMDASRVESIIRALRFVVTGSAATLINILALYVFTEYGGIWYIHSSILAFALSFAYNFTFQKYWVFKNTDRQQIPKQLPLHLAWALLGLVERTALLFVFVEFVHIWYILAQAIVSLIVAFQSFFVFRWIFR
jgi:putative flippase GtrA